MSPKQEIRLFGNTSSKTVLSFVLVLKNIHLQANVSSDYRNKNGFNMLFFISLFICVLEEIFHNYTFLPNCTPNNNFFRVQQLFVKMSLISD